jgi:hypothetical protein
MADIIYRMRITGGTAPGPYTIYYNSISPSNIAYNYEFLSPSTGVTFNELTAINGYLINIPNTSTDVIVYNETCFTNRSISVIAGVGYGTIGNNFRVG